MKFVFILISIIGGSIYAASVPVKNQTTVQRLPAVASPTPIPVNYADVDRYVDESAGRFSTSQAQKNAIKVKLHFLLLKESGYGTNTNCGDGGLSCGPLQFREPTWQGYRKIMLKKGIISDIGSRWNMKQSIETAAWAIADGREMAWGPLRRGELDL